eukprot:CFRG5364T1
MRSFIVVVFAALLCVANAEDLAAGSAPVAAKAEKVSGASDLTDKSFYEELKSFEYAMIAFGAPWCPYSNALQPVLNQLADFAGHTKASLVIGRVNCEENKAVCQRNQITKYPSIKFFQDGIERPHEYRGARTIRALNEFIFNEMKPVVGELGNMDVEYEISQKPGRKIVIARFRNGRETVDYEEYQKTAKALRGHCDFYVTDQEHHFEGAQGNRLLVVKKKGDHDFFNDKNSNAVQLDAEGLLHMSEWLTQSCKPLIDELTFENSEALVEEGKPLMILFTKPDDQKSRDLFKKTVRDLVPHEASRVKFLVADGTQFKHPLQHIAKTMDDLPVLAVDSFKHMYDFGEFSSVTSGTRMQTFINNLFNNQLHERFHHGDMAAKECMWRQTGNCISDGPREVHADKKCDVMLEKSMSGFCECGVDHFGVIIGFGCGHERMTCETACQKAHEDSRNQRLAQCTFRQTKDCDPHGEVEANQEKDCLTVIHSGQSGRCECSPSGPTIPFACEHDHFTCLDVCKTKMLELEKEIAGDIVDGIAEEKVAEDYANPYQRVLVEGMKKNSAEAAERSVKHDYVQRAIDLEPEGESQFEKLGPSKRRYSFIGNRDEL